MTTKPQTTPNDFTYKTIFYPDQNKYGFQVFEICDGSPVLRVASPAKWFSEWFAGMWGALEAVHLAMVARDHEKEEVAC